MDGEWPGPGEQTEHPLYESLDVACTGVAGRVRFRRNRIISFIPIETS